MFNEEQYERQKQNRTKFIVLHSFDKGFLKGLPISGDQLDEQLNIMHIRSIMEKYYD